MRETIRELISEEQVNERIRELGEKISKDYEGKTVHLVCILKKKSYIKRHWNSIISRK